MSVLIVHAAPGWSGTARIVSTIASGLAARGTPVLLAAHPDSRLASHLAGTPVEVVELRPSGGVLLQALRLRRLIRERKVDAALVHTGAELLATSIAVRLTSRGAVLRRIPADERPRITWRARIAARLVVTGVLYPAPSAAARALPLPAALPPRIVEPGIDHTGHELVMPASHELLHIPADARAVVALCDSDVRVRIPLLLRALGLLAERHPELRLVLVGPGSEDEQIRVHAAAIGVSSAVVQLGERADQLAVLCAADLGWVAARGDAGAMAFLDCMALRLPVLAERSPLSERYVADGITGVLLPPNDPPAAAAAIAALLALDERRLAMGNAAQARAARDFSADAMIDAVIRAVETARDRAHFRR